MKTIKKYFEYICRLIKELFIFNNCAVDFHFNDSQSTKIMTFNIRRDSLEDDQNNWIYRRDSIIEMLQHETPDIICFQEVMPTAAKFLIGKLSKFYDNAGLAIFMNKDLASCNMIFDEGLLIMWRKDLYELVDKNIEKLFDGRKINLRRFVDVTLKRKDNNECFNVINTHFCHISDKLQEESLKKILTYVQDLKEFYICGDLNTDVTRNKKLSDLISNHSYNQRKSDTDTSINWFGKTKANRIIDYIICNKPVIDSKILTDNFSVSYLSDHYPVIVYI